ncbi:MAG: aspartate ammonia-lyase [Thermomicrobiales bacterium]|nr:aspartate ammonia-lyase [Thermomicrobiales bacterium]MCO5219477.1 aspartate ammonia-lyase [Thermomicrobiales bacterium]MCO5228449.1 aspartate ammonia-lyase [Thermomicrobiales bacterium]
MTRIEKDLLGELAVPADAYYGIHTQRALDNFKISSGTIGDHPEFVRGLVMVKKASALANKELHTIEPEKADAIVAACDLILNEGRCLDQFPEDVYQGGAGTSVNMNANEVIANLALEVLGLPKGRYDVINPNDHVNKSQSTNDAYPSGFRIAVYAVVQNLRDEIQHLADSFEAKGVEFKDIIKMGRTQLQDAVPMTVGQEFHAFAVLMQEERRFLDMVAQFLLEVNLGATAIGTGLNTPPGYSEMAVRMLADVSGLPTVPAECLIEATSDTGAYVSMHGALKRLATKLSMICNDLRLLSSGPRAGLNEINLPERQAGSSIMPAKVNPVIPEVVNQICFKVIGNDMAVTMASEAGQLQLNVMEPVIGQCLFESVDLLINGSRTLRELCIDGITVNEDVCMAYVMNSIGIVTYLNERIGHAAGDEIGRRCAATGKSVREVVLEMGLMGETELNEILSPANLINPAYNGTIYQQPDPDVVSVTE